MKKAPAAVPKELIAAAQHGDRKALERLLAAEENRIYAFGMRMCRNPDDAADVLQETLLAVAKHIGEFRGESSLPTWLFQIARSFCIKKRRRRKGQPEKSESLSNIDEAAMSDRGPSPEQTASGKELEAMLHDALRSLPAPAREVIVLRDVEGLTAPEVAEVIGVSVGAVKSKLHRARSSLQEALAPRLGATLPPERSDCPDILAMYSRQLEGELSNALCAKLEKHVATCRHCTAACKTLKRNLALCSRLPVVPKDVQREVRRSVKQVMALRVRP